ncbi:hypothetical protein MPSEU_000473900 [Mayamaea pseudoterrestris]|nr:hypothetical protein MPSEU_000473900 [Mayamaea pseudoterrestris]
MELSNEKKMSKAAQRRHFETERGELMDVLEHLLVAGNHHRHEQMRVQEWNRRRIVPNVPRKRGRPKKDGTKPPPPPPTLHPQSIRIYGTNGRNEPQPWPKRTKSAAEEEGGLFICDDTAWNIEVGDNIDAIEFAKHRLALIDGGPRTDDDGAAVASSTLVIGSPEYKLIERNNVPRAMLLRCWERAVHAASTTNLVCVAGDSIAGTADASLANNSSNIDSGIATRGIAAVATRQGAIELSKRLGVGLKPFADAAFSSPTFDCPSCQLHMATAHQVDAHFYGSRDDKLLGCSWTLIRKRQQEVIEETLLKELTNQCNNLLHFLLVTAASHLIVKKQVQQKDATTDETLLCRWDDVLECLESHLAVAKGSSGAATLLAPRSGILATLETVPDLKKTPLVLNDQIIESITRRLIFRYCMVPR